MEILTLDWSRLTELNDTNVKSIPDKLPGIYRLSHKRDDKYYVFYVGQSDNIRKRLLEHLSSSESNEGIKHYIAEKKCYFRYAKVEKEDVRKAAKRQMYKLYEPSWNEAMPDGRDDIEVNLN